MNIIESENLSVVFGEHTALSKINLTVPEKSFVAIVGPNGAGKSTLLKVLLGIIKPTTGNVKILGMTPGEVDPERIGYVPQVKTMDRTFPALSIELVLTGLKGRWPLFMTRTDKQKAVDALSRVGADHLAGKSLGTLSGGELQRVCLARSIVRNPQIIMLDEPATGIDAVGVTDFYNLLEDYQQKNNSTILMVTHDWHVAHHHASLVLLLNREQIKFGSPQEVLTEENLRIAFGHIGHKHPLKA